MAHLWVLDLQFPRTGFLCQEEVQRLLTVHTLICQVHWFLLEILLICGNSAMPLGVRSV